jgi:hypothetical protein
VTDPQSDRFVQQAFFGWSHDVNSLVLLAHSFATEEEGHRYERILGPHIRLQPVGNNAVPFQALSYIEFGNGTVAVLRRVRAGYSSGRNNSHALIAPGSVLDVQVALGLGDSPVWKDEVTPGQPMPPLSADHFTGGAAFDRLTKRSAEFERDLVTVLTRLLDNIEEPLSVVGCPDADRLAMVWALGLASDQYLRDELGVARRWTFSTYEDRHDVSIERLPEMIFLPAKPLSAAVVRRTIVDLGREPVESPNTARAAQLIDAYLKGVAYTKPKQVRQTSGAAPGQVPPNSVSHSGVLLADGSPAQGGLRTSVAGLGPDEPRRLHEGVRERPSPRKQTVPAEHNPAAALLRARSVLEFDAELERLEMAAHLRHHREELREVFDLGALDTVTNFAEITAGREFLLRLLTVMYGPRFQDLGEPGVLKHATGVIRNCRSDQLAVLLGESAVQKDGEAVRRAAFERWAAAGTPGKPPLTRRAARAMRPARRGRFLPVVAAVAAIALLGIVFLLGFLAGRP